MRHLPLDRDSERAKRKREHAKLMTDARWEKHRRDREEHRAQVRDAGARDVGPLTNRDLVLLGAIAYWCEGAKEKPWKDFGQLIFTNSDPRLIRLYLAFLDAIGVEPARIEFRLYIHESADADKAAQWWSEIVGVPVTRFRPTSLKRHLPRTSRRNTGIDYHGCLAVSVRRSRELYWRIEGIVETVASGLPNLPQ